MARAPTVLTIRQFFTRNSMPIHWSAVLAAFVPLGVQFVLFLLIPRFAAAGNWVAFEAAIFTVFTMYGGGFATVPAFLADLRSAG